MDKGQELHTLEVLFSPASHNDLLKLDSPAREFFLRYLVAAFSIPLGIQHFAVAARYFEEGYLRRLKKPGRRPTSPWPPTTASTVNGSGV